MKFREVTWYSKLLALILFVVLPFAGFCAGMWYQKNIFPQVNDVVTNDSKTATGSANQSGWKRVVDTGKITTQTKYDGGTLHYNGTVQVPTACYKLKDETTVLESYPEQVQIRITAGQTKSDVGGVCAQVITTLEFSGQVQVSKDAVVTVFLDGEQVK
ncbi:MAG TPA: hypothetical protein VF303_00545 [Candidatus Nanoarchaeia archaeon]